jgi:hypothetical protein
MMAKSAKVRGQPSLVFKVNAKLKNERKAVTLNVVRLIFLRVRRLAIAGVPAPR